MALGKTHGKFFRFRSRGAHLIRRVKKIAREEGIVALGSRALTRIRRRPSTTNSYARWIAIHDTLDNAARQQISENIATLPSQPLISLLLPACDDGNALNATLASLRAQIYPHWELVLGICDSAGKRLDTPAATVSDARIRLIAVASHEPWSAKANRALAAAQGDFIALIDAGDQLSEHALYWVAREALACPDAALIFSDEDTIRGNGTRSRPWFKSDWNPALMLSQNAVGRLGAWSRDLVSRLGGLRAGYEGAEEYELILRSTRAIDAVRIRHIPRILYHRSIGTRGLADTAESRGEVERRAVGEHLVAQGISATVRPDRGINRVAFSAPHPAPRVTVVIATTARREIAEPCFTSLAERTHYDDLEVLVLAHGADLERPERAAFIKAFADKTSFRVIRHSVRPFNYSAVNNLGARAAKGDVLCFLNDDTETIAGDWLQQLVARVALPGVGAAGPMLYYPDATIQHAGVILGLGGVAGHACCHQPRGSSGYFGRACLEQDVSCVTAACMAIRADVFRAAGGFDEKLPMAYNDVDLCLRVRALNWRIIWTPAVELLHHESASLGRHDSAQHAGQYAHDVGVMRERWHAALQSDPFYNPNLSLDHGHQLAFPPRLAATDRPVSTENP